MAIPKISRHKIDLQRASLFQWLAKVRLANLCVDSWGFADIEAAIATIPNWINTVGWEGPAVDGNSWLVVGHSNGGTFLKRVQIQTNDEKKAKVLGTPLPTSLTR